MFSVKHSLNIDLILLSNYTEINNLLGSPLALYKADNKEDKQTNYLIKANDEDFAKKLTESIYSKLFVSDDISIISIPR